MGRKYVLATGSCTHPSCAQPEESHEGTEQSDAGSFLQLSHSVQGHAFEGEITFTPKEEVEEADADRPPPPKTQTKKPQARKPTRSR